MAYRIRESRPAVLFKKRWLSCFCLLVMGLVFFFAVFSSCRPGKPRSEKGVIAVSIEPLRYFTERIVGGRFDVVSVVPEGYSPETYEPAPEQLFSVSEAKAYIKVGRLGFETTWLDKISRNEPKLPIYDTSDSLEHSVSGLRLVSFDPHTWTSPRNAEVISRSICSALCQIDSSGAEIYQKNLEKLLLRIRAVDVSIRKTLEDLTDRTFVTAHPSLTYFAGDYGLRQLSIEKDGKEPSPTELAGLVRQCKQEKVRVILVQPEFSRESAKVLAEEIGAEVVDIHPLSYQWEQEMLQVAKALKAGAAAKEKK